MKGYPQETSEGTSTNIALEIQDTLSAKVTENSNSSLGDESDTKTNKNVFERTKSMFKEKMIHVVKKIEDIAKESEEEKKLEEKTEQK